MKTLGSYEILDELGRGGMGVVLRARHGPTGAIRAIKLFNGAFDDEGLERFRREARALAALEGKGVVRIHELGVEGGRAWFAMDFLTGGSLRDRLRLRGRLEWREACRLVARLARTLGRCHELGLVHRDVKPDNVLFAEPGSSASGSPSVGSGASEDEDEPKLADFGCVHEPGAARLTVSGALLGTPAYMAPEQLRGESDGAPADVYAVGVLLHEAIVGERPFDGSPVTLMLKILEGARPRVAHGPVPVELDALLDRTLAADPAVRPTAAVLARQLEALAAGKDASPALGRGLALPIAGVALVAALVTVGLVATRGPAATSPIAAPTSPARTAPSPSGGPEPITSASNSSPSSPPTPEVAALESRVAAFGAAVAGPGALDPARARSLDARVALAQLHKKDRAAFARALVVLARATWKASAESYADASHLDEQTAMRRCELGAAALDEQPGKRDDLLVTAVIHWVRLLKLEIARSRHAPPGPVPGDDEVRTLDEEIADVRRKEPVLALALRWRAVEVLWEIGTYAVDRKDELVLDRAASRVNERLGPLADDVLALVERRPEDPFVHRLGRDVLRRAADFEMLAARNKPEDAFCSAGERAIRLREQALGLLLGDKREDDLRSLSQLRFEVARVIVRGSRDRLAPHVAALERIAEEPALNEDERGAISGGIAHFFGSPDDQRLALARLRRVAEQATHDTRSRTVLLTVLAALELDVGAPVAARRWLSEARVHGEQPTDVPIYAGVRWPEVDAACAARESASSGDPSK